MAKNESSAAISFENSDVSVTKQLCSWIQETPFSAIPPEVIVRAKHLILDGLACAMVGSHLPWSETAARAVLKFEPVGSCTVIGWGSNHDCDDNTKLSPLAATLLNSTFIQAFELDDYHSRAPLHSNAVLIPSLFSAVEEASSPSKHTPRSKREADANNDHHTSIPHRTFTGREFLRAYVLGAEIGPRVGLALGGTDLIARGWHSGALQGGPAAATAVGALLGLDEGQVESALGIACTQAGGLMAAQFGSAAKRMQHGFAARNGLLAALLAREGYTGIRDVFETRYGGFLSCFAPSSSSDRLREIVDGLGDRWETAEIRVKLHAAMAALHGPIQAVAELQELHPDRLRAEGDRFDDDDSVESVVVRLGKAAYEHGGWMAPPPNEQLSSTAAQMSVQYAIAAQLLDREVTMAQFGASKLNRAKIRGLMQKVRPVHDVSIDALSTGASAKNFRCVVEIHFRGGAKLVRDLDSPKGISPPATNEEVVSKWRTLVKGVLSDSRREVIERMVLHLEDSNDIRDLIDLLAGKVECPIEI